ncbi:MAG: polysaccharide lyase [bacterium]
MPLLSQKTLIAYIRFISLCSISFILFACGGGGGGGSAQPNQPTGPQILVSNDTAQFTQGDSDYDAVVDVLVNDTVDGHAVNKSLYTVTSSDAASMPELSIKATGIVDLIPNITAGTYSFRYTVCENANSNNCNSAAVDITVDPLPANVLYTNNFDHDVVGTYTDTQREADFGPTDINYGIADGRVAVTPNGKDNTTALRMTYPGGVVGATHSGATWRLPLGADYNRLTSTYDFKFDPQFNWDTPGTGQTIRRGGKLLGIMGGGLSATGGHPATGANGWSSRFHWKDNGTLCQYVYHMDQVNNVGDCFYFWDNATPQTRAENLAMHSTERLHINKGQFYNYSQTVIINDIGQHNGEIIAKIDGKVVVHITDIMFRNDPDLAIEDFYFTTYLGGGDNNIMDYTGYITVDNLRITTD